MQKKKIIVFFVCVQERNKHTKKNKVFTVVCIAVAW